MVEWFQMRGEIAPTRYDLPMVGFVCPGIAAGFLIATDTKTAVIDFLVTNPSAQKIHRGKAIDKIARALISYAKKQGYNFIKCDSKIDSIHRKAFELGFQTTGNYLSFIKEL